MQQKIIYIADDGEEFASKEACFNHEHRFDILKTLPVFGTMMVPLDLDDFGHAYYVCVQNEEQANALCEYTRYSGIPLPTTIGWFRYDKIIEDWVEIESELSLLKNTLDLFRKEVEKWQTQ